MARTLLLGASGQLGSALQSRIDDVIAPPHSEIDLAALTPETARHLLEAIRPVAVVNCAAWTAVDAAEENEAVATAVNGTAVGILAAAADYAGVPFVTYSTDYVFDGTSDRPYREDDPPSPINAYGRSKLVGEQAALQYPGSLVIRTSWVQSGTHPCFVRKMIELARDRGELRVVDDQFGRPSFVKDLATATLQALDDGITGLMHVANEGEATWFELARETLRIASIPTRIEAVETREFPTPAKRPRYSVLDTTRMKDTGIAPLPPWQAALAEAVEDIMSMPQ